MKIKKMWIKILNSVGILHKDQVTTRIAEAHNEIDRVDVKFTRKYDKDLVTYSQLTKMLVGLKLDFASYINGGKEKVKEIKGKYK